MDPIILGVWHALRSSAMRENDSTAPFGPSNPARSTENLSIVRERIAYIIQALATALNLRELVELLAGNAAIVPLCHALPGRGCDVRKHNEGGRPCKKPGKIPRVAWKRYQTEIPSRAQVLEWQKQWPHAGWALVTGELNGILVLDQDRLDVPLDLPGTVGVRTPREGGGRHHWFRYPPGSGITIGSGDG